ncbi:DUF4102 domain-containing protein [Ancylobacter defluvii]|nr:DUF4102 domain-containing protein [Ancylobacter defluvii]
MPPTDTAVRNAKGKEQPYKLSDGGGLYVPVNQNGSRYERLAYRFSRKQKTSALGTYPSVTLADARTRRDEAKRVLAPGTDPSEKRRADKQAVAARYRHRHAFGLCPCRHSPRDEMRVPAQSPVRLGQPKMANPPFATPSPG